MYMGEVPQTKTDAVSNLLKTYLPQYSKQIDVLTGKQVVTTVPANQAAAKPADNTGKNILIGGGLLLLLGIGALAMRR